MATKPILFSGSMVRALLEGRKTQTRRVIKGIQDGEQYVEIKSHGWYALDCRSSANAMYREIKAPYAAGDLLWVRETWGVSSIYDGIKPSDLIANFCKVGYAADDGLRGCKKRPGIFMPRWASRLTLDVTNVRVERLQNISAEDALAEGTMPPGTGGDPRAWFHTTWDDINGEASWRQNPWIVALTFTVHKCNVDSIPQRVTEVA